MVALIVVAAVSIIWWRLSSPTTSDDPESGGQDTVASHLSAVALADDGDINGALRQYDEAIKTHDDDKTQTRTLLVHKASLAMQSQRYEDAITAAKHAEEIEPSDVTNKILATAYEATGQTENSITYYQKLIDQTDEDSPDIRYVGIWQEKVKELQE